ncbi:hypothetical protein AGDE_15983 [Angomonas deanei]|uniref:BRCA1 C Terminus (BRCT) domain containing protein, putative n=1 Tax=Angomonas deanei TaxID=59799 RepID=A0A7G2CQY5_9TRYP|nr:hypothetical protein AGDE_15983 [Angomonas deanei]CAD2220602.1 BRCA1 C Terminus (BRCT) domain containing protein, putative [Angomonas deanei]|eukprot:EPY17985.1 hypothetical protein AGDE_15983 [Angomonas deanei]
MVTTNGGEVVCVSPQYNKDVPCNIVVLQVCPETNNTLTILEKADVPVVNQEWVTDCVRYSTIMDPSVYHRAKGEVLRGYQVQIPKGEPLRTEWERLATLMGATVSNDSPDALVVTTRPTGQYIDANLSASTVVHPRWLTDCALAQTALSTKNYGLSTMRQSLVDEDDEDDISNCSTETYVYDNEESNSKK